MIAHWKPLPLNSDSNLPTLLYQLNVSASAYAIYLTDLTNIWTESLDRKQIIRRAFDENASIDPSEGPDQFRLLLHNIQEALEARPNTSLKIQLPEAAVDTLTLIVTATLPAPLAPFIWPIRPVRAPDRSFFDEFLYPCLTSLGNARSEVLSLLNLLKDKDRVIARLTDKLEVMGIDISTVFPNAAPSKRSKATTRDVVVSTVKGLKAFDEDKWRDTIAAGPKKDLKTLCGELFSDVTPITCPFDQRPHYTAVSNFGYGQGSGHKTTKNGATTSLPRHNSADDEFQGQLPPAREVPTDSYQSSVKKPSPISDSKTRARFAAEANDLSSDITDDDLDAPVTSTKVTSKINPSVSQKGNTKLGILGGRRKYQAKAISPPPGSPEQHNLEKQDDPINRPGDVRVTRPLPSNPKGKLGKIGGHRKVDKKSDGQTAANDTAVSHASGPQEEASNVVSDSDRGRESVKNSASPMPKSETSKDRADRNRERLKRELEEKGKVVIKRKRKF